MSVVASLFRRRAMKMTFSRLWLLASGLTLLVILFIVANRFWDVPIFWHLLAAHDLPAGWLMLAILLVGHWFGAQDATRTNWVNQLLLALDRQRYGVACALWLILCGGSILIYRNHPLSMDEYAVFFQAKIFAAGSLHGGLPPDLLDYLIPPRFQNGFLMVNHETGAALSGYLPGFSLLLTPFMWLGVPWACNPTLVAASFLLIGRIARDLIDSPLAAGWALLFALASPAFVANGITYYSMPAHLFLNLCFAWLLIAPTRTRLIIAGMVGGLSLVLHQPFPHAVFALPWIGWLALQRDHRFRNLGLLILGYLPVFLLLGAGWWLWRQGILYESIGVSGLADSQGADQQTITEWLHKMLVGIMTFVSWPDGSIINARLGGLAKLWLWASPLLLLLAWWGWRGEKNPAIRLLGASALLTFVAYFLIQFDQGHGWGYRYFHSAWGVLPILAALGTIKLAEVEGTRVLRQVALLALISLVAANALRFGQMGEFMAAHLAQFPPRVEAERRIVLHNGLGYYAYDLIQNDPWLRGGEIVFLLRSKADREKILEHYPTAKEVSRNRFGSTMTDAGAGR